MKVTVRFRGREMAHTDIGKGLLLKFAEQCGEVATLDKDPKAGRTAHVHLPLPQGCQGSQEVLNPARLN